MNLDGKIVQALAELKIGLERIYGDRLKGMYVYGSYARGTQRPSSDIDIAFVLNDFRRPGPEIERTNRLITDLSLRLDTTISLVPVREGDFRRKASLLVRSVAREGIAV